MLLKDAIALAKHNHGNQHTVNRIQPILFAPLNTRSKHFFQSCCWCAGGKCDRCRSSGCADRDWRKQGREVP